MHDLFLVQVQVQVQAQAQAQAQVHAIVENPRGQARLQ
jgi:hypothetical protein